MTTNLVDVGGHRLSVRLAGSGQQVVVLESHLGGTKSAWRKVWRQVAGLGTVCVYDRAGLGESEAGPLPRTLGRATLDLHRLLRRLSLSPPFVLVGHSFGGLIIQAFAKRYPKLVGGVILVDSTHADQERRLGPLLKPSATTRMEARRRAANPEHFDLSRLSADVGRYGPFPAVPLRVLTAPVPADVMKGFAAPRTARRVLADLDRELAALSPGGRLIKVSNTSHFIQIDRPDVVLRQIDAVINELRRLA